MFCRRRVTRGGVVERRTGSEDRQNHRGPPRSEGYWGRLKALFRAERRRSRTYPPTGYAGLASFEDRLGHRARAAPRRA